MIYVKLYPQLIDMEPSHSNTKDAGTIEMFFSKSKDDIDSDVLGLGIRDWRKRLSNFWPAEVKVAFDVNQPPKTYPSVEHAFHAGKAALCSDKPAMARWFEIGKICASEDIGRKACVMWLRCSRHALLSVAEMTESPMNI